MTVRTVACSEFKLLTFVCKDPIVVETVQMKRQNDNSPGCPTTSIIQCQPAVAAGARSRLVPASLEPGNSCFSHKIAPKQTCGVQALQICTVNLPLSLPAVAESHSTMSVDTLPEG
ncbi:hypothetical protein INR49_023630 [Caranx melampygus]|nr:hypothetical protein INR49_023630 [Caranx melampygus]